MLELQRKVEEKVAERRRKQATLKSVPVPAPAPASRPARTKAWVSSGSARGGWAHSDGGEVMHPAQGQWGRPRPAPTSPGARPQAHQEQQHWRDLQQSRERRLRTLQLSTSAAGHGRRQEAA